MYSNSSANGFEERSTDVEYPLWEMREVAELTLGKMWNDIHTSTEVKSNTFLDINRCGYV